MFKSLFKRKVKIPTHDENWQVYFSRINNQLTSVIVDINVAEIAPIKALSEVFYLITPFDFANDEGLPTLESYQLINEVEDKISELLVRFGENMLHVSTLTMNSERLQMYYCHKVENTKAFLVQIEKDFGQKLTYQIDHRHDPNWSDYFNLAYPLPFQMEMIKNRILLKELVNSGDDLKESRNVNHFLDFKEERDAEQFLEFAESERFVLFLKERRDDSWKVGISRQDYLGYEEIDELCLPIWEKAKVFNGTYSGWESEVIRNKINKK